MTLHAAHPFRNRPSVGITDLDRAPTRTAIPLDVLAPLLAEFNAGIEKAKRSYYGKTYHERRIAHAEANQRWRARKKGQQQ